MRRAKSISVRVRAPSRGLVTRLPGESADLLPSKGGVAIPSTLMSLGSFQRAASFASNVRYENGVTRNAPGYESVQISNSILEDVVAYWAFDSISSSSSVNVSGINYVGSPQPVATVPVTQGQVYSINPGVNENGILLINGSQSIALSTNSPVIVTAQADSISFKYTNLIPLSAVYGEFGDYQFSVVPGHVFYNVVWGANEAALQFLGLPSPPLISNPAVGQITTTYSGSIASAVFNSSGSQVGIAVTSQVYLAASNLPLTAVITTLSSTLDGSGNNNNLIQPFAAYPVTGTSGKFNGAVLFDLVPAGGWILAQGIWNDAGIWNDLSEWVDTGDSVVSGYLFSTVSELVGLSSGSFSATFWFNPTTNGSFAATTILSAPGWSITQDTDGQIHFILTNSSNAQSNLASAYPIIGSSWNFISVTYNAVTQLMTLSLNGVTSSTTASVLPTQPGTTFQLGIANLSASYALDEMVIWSRALSALEIAAVYAEGNGNVYPLAGGPFNLIFQANLIDSTDESNTPVILATNMDVWNLTTLYNEATSQYQGDLNLLFEGNEVSDGYTWTADNFNNVVILAEHDNPAQYWLPPYPNLLQPLPGLPSDSDTWDGVCVFQGHVLLWSGQTLQWSDLDDYTMWIPVSETAVSAVLTLESPFIQPAPNSQVAVQITNTVAQVLGLTASGNLTFGNVTVGQTAQQLVNLENTGTGVVTVTGVSLPSGYSGQLSGNLSFPVAIPVGQSVPYIVTFSPTTVTQYSGTLSVASNATPSESTTTLPISGTGIGSTYTLALSGILSFGSCKESNTLASSLIITNTGTATVTVSSISLPNGFSISSGGWSSGTVASGATQIVPITFAPTTAQVYSGDITVNVTSPATVSPVIAVSGTGVSSLGAATVFVTDNGTLQFGNEQIGNVLNGTLTIYNPSSSAFSVTGVTLPNGWSTTFTGSVSIAAFSSHTIPVTFSPTTAQNYGGLLYLSFNRTVAGTGSLVVQGIGILSGANVSLSGSLAFGDATVGGSVQALLTIANVGTTAFTVSSLSYTGSSVFSGNFVGTIQPGSSQNVLITFAPTTAGAASGTLTVNFSGTVTGTNTMALSGTGVAFPTPAALVAGQYVSLADTRNGVTYYNFYSVVSMSWGTTNGTLVLQAIDTTGTTAAGLTMPADGRQFFTVDANEAGSTEVVGAQMNGPIFNVIPQGDYAYIFKEYSIQSVQYTGQGNGTFFIHNEVFGEGLLSRNAVVNRSDGVMVFLGHKELYAYQGGPSLIPVCQQTTQQLYAELDRSRLFDIRLFHNDLAHEIWVKYPVVGGFRVLIWNYQEDSASFDDYDASLDFQGLGLVDWSTSTVWNQMAASVTWQSMLPNQTWESLAGETVNHAPVLGGNDGSLLIFGLNYDRDGNSYVSTSETMDFDLGDADIWKYCDTIVIGLQVNQPVPSGTMMQVQVCGQGSLGGTLLEYNPSAPQQTGMWSAPQNVLVDGTAPIPVKVNPGGAGRYFRVRFTSNQTDVQWRVSSFEIHCRQGGLY